MISTLEKARIIRSSLIEQGYKWLRYGASEIIEPAAITYYVASKDLFTEGFLDFDPIDLESDEALALLIAAQLQEQVKVSF